MKNKDLINKLSILDPEMEVCVFDYERNIREDSGEGSGSGVYTDFYVEEMNKEQILEGTTPWIAIGFKNYYIEDEDNQITHARD